MSEQFKKNGFLIVREFFNKELISIMAEYFKLKYQVSLYCKEDKSDMHTDIGESYYYYSDSLCESTLMVHGQRISSLLGLDLTPTYTYARIYEKGDRLVPHRDRAACEISSTSPILTVDNTPSVIYISKYKASKFNNESSITYEEARSGDYTKVELYPGDVLFYKGCEHYHWRDPLETPYLCQFFMHLIQTNGTYKDYYFDNRPIMGLPVNYSQRIVHAK